MAEAVALCDETAENVNGEQHMAVDQEIAKEDAEGSEDGEGECNEGSIEEIVEEMDEKRDEQADKPVRESQRGGIETGDSRNGEAAALEKGKYEKAGGDEGAGTGKEENVKKDGGEEEEGQGKNEAWSKKDESEDEDEEAAYAEAAPMAAANGAEGEGLPEAIPYWLITSPPITSE
ncbi:hypothetical protein HPB52_004736 [Rhipicephalus sanguineus]|uniref:Uncharacterized protein n=1 Tax=Rhipicephalus sanguineus TaxID=34632 RepID=A0A9D4PQF1_RHISA|nr:hypothetical protein HPB52_004736 [Rhipicephalus sanguineus]